MPETSWLASPTAACDSRIGESLHDPGRTRQARLLFNALAMVAEFEADLIRARTREGMAVAKAAVACAASGRSCRPARERPSSFSGPAGTPLANWPRTWCQSGHRLPCCPACRRSMSTIDVGPEQVQPDPGGPLETASRRIERPYPLTPALTPQRTVVCDRRGA